jgi:hypothetical protein
MDPVGELERRFIPLLEGTGERLAGRFPDCRFSVYSSPFGPATSRGHDVGLECVMPDAPPDRADNVALSIGLIHLSSEPKIGDAGVTWGGDGSRPDVDLVLIHEPIPFSSAALADLERKFSILAAVFEQAVDAWHELNPA